MCTKRSFTKVSVSCQYHVQESNSKMYVGPCRMEVHERIRNFNTLFSEELMCKAKGGTIPGLV
jgi:hypothetical protein